MGTWNKRSVDPRFLNVADALEERSLVNKRSVLGRDRDVTGDVIDFAEIAAAYVVRAARVAVPIDEETGGS